MVVGLLWSAAELRAAPTISSVSPNPVTGSTSQQSITINGTGFVNAPTLLVTWTGGSATLSGTQVTFVSSTQLRMAITTQNDPDNWTVKVTNPNGGGSSSAFPFTVLAPTPSIASLSTNPSAPTPGTFSFTINGSGFYPAGALILVTGPGCTPCTIPNGVLTTKTTTTLSGPATLNTAGAYSFVVQNGFLTQTGGPGPQSNGASVTVGSGITITSISPSSPPVVNGNQNVQVLGTNFQANLTVQVSNGSGTPIGTLSGSQIQSVTSTSFTMVINLGSAAGSFRIQVINPNNQTSNVFSFSTQSTNLAAPMLISPSNGATGAAAPVSFSWSAVTGANSGYRLLVATSPSALPSDPTADTCSCVINDTPSGTSDSPSGLQAGTTYYWEVHGRSTTQLGNWSSVYSFTTAQGPSITPAPTLLSPSNGATNVTLPVSLSWSAVSGANAGYRVLIATSPSALPTDPTVSSCGGCVVNDTPSGTSDSPSGLQANTTYYWEVHGRSSAEYGTWSSVYSFRTGGAEDFTVSASPGSQTVTQGNSTSYTVTVQSQNGFNSGVSLTVLSLPGNQVLPGTGFSPQTVTPPANGSVQSTLTIVTNSSTATGTFSMTVQGVSGNVTHTYGVSITVNPIVQITNVQPLQFTAKSSAQNLTLIGTAFAPGAVVLVSAPGAPTPNVQSGAVSNTQIILSMILNISGTWKFQVRNPDNSFSNTFTVLVGDAEPATTGTIIVNSNIPSASYKITPTVLGLPGTGPYPVRISANPGDYSVQFQPISGYTTPLIQTSAVRSGESTTFTGTYVASATSTLLSDTPSLNFSYSSPGIGTAQSKTVNIRSSGPAVTFVTSSTLNDGIGWLTINPQSGSTPRALNISVSGNLAPGQHSASLTLTALDSSVTPLTIPIVVIVDRSAAQLGLDLVDPIPFFADQAVGGILNPDQTLLRPDAPIRRGLAADGVSRLILRFKATEPGSFAIDLVDSNGKSLSQSQAGLLFAFSIHTKPLGNGHYAFTTLQAPEVWTRSAINIKYTFKADSDGSYSLGTKAVNLLRPPVILVHGLWDDHKGWSDSWGGAGATSAGCPTAPPASTAPFVCRVDYSANNLNSAKLSQIAPVLKDQMDKQINAFKDTMQVAAVQADVIAHSLGGLAVRTLPQCGGTFKDCNVMYRSSQNYFRGTVHRLITISTPHLGTDIATILVDNRRNTCFAGVRLEDIFSALQHPLGGAFDDMVSNGGAVRGIQDGIMPFPIHFFAGVASDNDHVKFARITDGAAVLGATADAFGSEEGLLAILAVIDIKKCLDLARSLDSFQAEQSDLLVPVASALNGLFDGTPGTELSTTKYGNMIHSSAITLNHLLNYSVAERDSPSLATDSLNLLIGDASNFWMPTDASGLPIGIGATKLGSLTSQPSSNAAISSISTAQGSTLFSIISPAEGAVVPPGFSLSLVVQPTSTQQLIQVDVISPAGWFHFDHPSQTLSIPLPNDRQGPFRLTVIGTVQNGDQGSQVRTISIESQAAAQSISVTPGILHIYLPNTTRDGKPSSGALRIVGQFAESSRDITSSSLVTFSTENAAVAQVDSTGNVTPVAPGQTAIVVTYGKLTASGVVQVNMSQLRGDLNGDGVIDGLDFALIQRAVGQKTSGPDDPRDLNGDGVIDSKDVAALSAMCSSSFCGGSTVALAVVNAGSFLVGGVAPGELISLFGDGLSLGVESASGLPLPSSLGGLQVLINEVQAPLLFVGAGQINAQVPYGLSLGSGTLKVMILGTTVLMQPINILQGAPGLFSANGRSIIQNQDYSLNTRSNGASVGDYVVVYFTGQGAVDADVSAGNPAPAQPPAHTLAKTEVTIGGMSSFVSYSGLTPGFAGLGQINVRVPELPAGDYPIIVSIAGIASNTGVVSIR